MKPLSPTTSSDAAPVETRGHRSNETLLRIDERNQYLREAAHRFFPGCSNREAARRLHIALGRYRSCRWQRDRSEATCPAQHAGRLKEMLFFIFKSRDMVPSVPSIRAALGASARAS